MLGVRESTFGKPWSSFLGRQSGTDNVSGKTSRASLNFPTADDFKLVFTDSRRSSSTGHFQKFWSSANQWLFVKVPHNKKIVNINFDSFVMVKLFVNSTWIKHFFQISYLKFIPNKKVIIYLGKVQPYIRFTTSHIRIYCLLMIITDCSQGSHN